MSSSLLLLSGKKRPRPQEPELWSLEWKEDDYQQNDGTVVRVARLHAQQECQVAVQGRGMLRRCCHDTSSDDDGDDDGDAVVTVNGFRLPKKYDKNDGYRFDCPAWSSWATLSLSAGSVVEIVSSNSNSRSSKNSSSSNCHGDDATGICNEPSSFQVWSAHDPQARPTVIPPSWKQAVDAIEHDLWQRHYQVAAAAAATTDSQQKHHHPQQHLLIHRESLEDDDDDQTCSISPEAPRSCFQVFFCGAKNVGKSTCLRYCLNRLLSSSSNNNNISSNNSSNTTTTLDSVAVLDADVGQSELGPPGMLTLSLCRQPLLQQPHCYFLYDNNDNHNNKNNGGQQQQQQQHSYLDAYFFGATSSQVDPARYIQGIHKLLNSFAQYSYCGGSGGSSDTRTTQCSIPLLVNLDGWVKGLGLQVLQAIVQQHQPAHVVQILGDLKSRQFDLSLAPADAVVTASTTTTTTSIAAAAGSGGGNDDNCISTKVHVCYAYHSKQAKTPPTMSRASSMVAVYSDDNKTPVLSRSSSFAAGDNVDDENANDDDERNGNDKIEMTDPQQQEHISPQQQQRQQQQPTVVAAHSMSLPSASLRTLRLLAYFLERHNEQDDSLLQIWDRVGLGQTQQEGFLDADVTCEMAHRLAAAVPYVVPMETVEVVFSNTELHNDICSEQGIWDALNGSIVGLLCKEPEQKDVGMSAEQLAMLPCVGLGIVRAIDCVGRLFYILTPVPHNKLVAVNVLSLANHSLTLPFESVYRGVHSEASPNLAYDNDNKKTNKVLGAEPMKSRNSIARKSLVGSNG